MAEQRSVKIVPLDRLLEELTEALKTGKKEQVESTFQEMRDSIRQALVEKSRACMYLQQMRGCVSGYEENPQWKG